MTYHSIEITADYNRQTEMADWCVEQLVDGEWGFDPIHGQSTERTTPLSLGTWRWCFYNIGDLQQFRDRWPWVSQSNYDTTINHDTSLQRRFDDIKAWATDRGIEIELMDNNSYRYSLFDVDQFLAARTAGNIWTILCVRFPEGYDDMYFKLAWL